MKKSILATFLAGLVTLGAMAGDAPHKMEFRLEKADDGQTSINVIENGQTHRYEFTNDELQDEALIESRLIDLDDKTRSHVVKALQSILDVDSNLVFVDEDTIEGDGQKVVIVKDFRIEGGDGDGHDQKHRVFIDVDGEHDGKMMKRVFESKDGQAFAFKIGGDDTKIEWVQDGGQQGHMAKALEHMLKNTELTQDQIDTLQKLLDEKR